MLAATQRVKLTARKSCTWQSARHYQYFGDGTMRHQRQDSTWDKMIKVIQPPVQPGTLIVVRHGESEWNAKRLFTGWVDTDLTDRGIREIEHASRLLLERGYTVDITYTSLLKRAVRSSWIMLNEINQIYTPVVKTWRLNERMYVSLAHLWIFCLSLRQSKVHLHSCTSNYELHALINSYVGTELWRVIPSLDWRISMEEKWYRNGVQAWKINHLRCLQVQYFVLSPLLTILYCYL